MESTLKAGDELAGKGAKAPRVTLESLQGKIKSEQYVHPDFAPHVTVAILETENGFCLVGMSAPADPTNFDAEKGRTFAKDDALRRLWSLEGYLLREGLYLATKDRHAG
jgi:hypothetical protein